MSGKTCSYYTKPGGCRHGDKCRFSHDSASSSPKGQRTGQSSTPQKPWQARKMCTAILQGGHCPRGSACLFSHDSTLMQTTARRVDGDAELYPPTTAPYGHISRTLENYVQRPLISPRDFAQFAQAVENIGTSKALDSGDQADLIVLMVRQAGPVIRMSQVFLEDALDLNVGVLPLFRFLSSEAVLRSVNLGAVNQLYGALDHGISVINRIDAFLEQVAGSNGQKLNPHLAFRCFKTVLTVLVEYICRFRQARVTHKFMDACIANIHAAMHRWTGFAKIGGGRRDAFSQLSQPMREHHLNTLCQDGERLLKAIGRVQAKAGVPRTLGPNINTNEENDLIKLRQLWRPPGGRHAFDYTDIRQIPSVPNVEELLCRQVPSIPANFPLAPHHMPDDSVGRQVDTLFRLLREDFVSQIRVITQGTLEDLPRRNSELSKAIQSGSGGRKSLRIGDHSVFFFLYPETVIETTTTSSDHSDFAITISFKLPPRSAGRLEHGALVVIIDPHIPNVAEQAFLFKLDKDMMPGHDGRGKANLVAFDSRAYAWAVPSRKKARQIHRRSLVLVEVPGILLTAIIPFLEALKSLDLISLPFARYLGAPTPDVVQDLSMEAPQFARSPNFYYDLSTIVSDGETRSLKTNIADADSWTVARARLVDSNALDASQTDALLHCLRSEVALIEGPPGTGKSYIGLQIVRTLLKSRVKPILLLCVTNHALDQFLEGLIDAKVTEKIVRLGSKSKSPRVEPFTLFSQKQTLGMMGGRGRYSGKAHYELLERRKELEEQIGRLSASCFRQPGLSTLATIGHWLSANFKEHHTALETPPTPFDVLAGAGDRGLYTTVSKENSHSHTKAQSPKDNLHFWSTGADIDILSALYYVQQGGELEQPAVDDLLSQLEDAWFQMLQPEGAPMEPAIDDFLPLVEDPSVQMLLRDVHSPQSVSPTLDELLDHGNIWQLCAADRRRLLDFWESQSHLDDSEELDRARRKLADITEELRALDNEWKSRLLSSCEVIAATTNGAASLIPLLRSAAPKVMIVEEAGEVLEGQIWASLVSSMQQMVLIGDHLQLRPHIATYGLSLESRLGRLYRADQSLFERLVNSHFPMSCLSVQRRMRPEISQLIRATLYPQLIDHPQTKTYPKVKGVTRNVVFISHKHAEDKGSQDHSSRANSLEADLVRAFALYLLRQGYTNRLSIVTPYLGQVKILRAMFARDKITVVLDERDEAEITAADDGPEPPRPVAVKDAVSAVRITSIDNFQGEEDDIVILSLVRNSALQQNETALRDNPSIGFLKTPNRANVALSRARHGMYILGDADLLESKSEFWRTSIGLLRKQNRVLPGIPIICEQHPERLRVVKSPDDFRVFAPDGGCVEPCAFKLSCGHTCSLKCHPDDPSHMSIRCPRACTRLLERCGHPCRNICGEPCGPCRVLVGSIELPCGHQKEQATCSESQDPESVECDEMLERHLECGHTRLVKCGLDHAEVLCSQVCGASMPCCKRKCAAPCAKCTKCSKHAPHPCGRPLDCGHDCDASCGHTECPPCQQTCAGTCPHPCSHPCVEPCVPCKSNCGWVCPHQAHCVVPCGSPCTRLPCDEPCTKYLPCGHPCSSICGERCSTQICPICAPPEELQRRVDVICMETLGEIDIDVPGNRLLRLACGHIFTTESLDGQLGLADFYQYDSDIGRWTGLLPGPTNWVEIPTCMDCRRPISTEYGRRYGRVIKRAQLDRAERQALAQKPALLSTIATSFDHASVDVSGFSATTVDVSGSLAAAAPVAPNTPKSRFLQEAKLRKQKRILLHSSIIFNLPQNIFSESVRQQWKQATRHLRKVYDSLSAVTNHRPPTVDAYEAAVTAMEAHLRQSLDAQPVRDPSTFLRRELRRALGAPPRVDAKFAIEASRMAVNVFLRLAEAARTCSGSGAAQWTPYLVFLLRAAARSSQLTAELAESSQLHEKSLRCWARFVEIEVECASVEAKEFERVRPRTDEERTRTAQDYEARLARIFAHYDDPRDDFLKDTATQEQIQDIDMEVDQIKSQGQALITSIRTGGVFYQSVSLEEKIMVTKAMGFATTGHWFRCGNGHAFTIGECGGAMELSRCPECGGPVGGHSHRLTDGNRIDTELDAIAARGGARREPYLWDPRAL